MSAEPDPAAAQSARADGDRLAATALFLMTEYMSRRSPLLASLVASELRAIERRAGAASDLSRVAAKLRERWWLAAQNEEMSWNP